MRALILLLLTGCTIQVSAPVPQPNITIKCVVVELGGGTILQDCPDASPLDDAGPVDETAPPTTTTQEYGGGGGSDIPPSLEQKTAGGTPHLS